MASIDPKIVVNIIKISVKTYVGRCFGIYIDKNSLYSFAFTGNTEERECFR